MIFTTTATPTAVGPDWKMRPVLWYAISDLCQGDRVYRVKGDASFLSWWLMSREAFIEHAARLSVDCELRDIRSLV